MDLDDYIGPGLEEFPEFGDPAIHYLIFTHQEDEAPQDHFVDDEDVQNIYNRMEQADEWAWCAVEVQAVYNDPVSDKAYSSSDYLGGCSYEDEEAFKQGGYYEDMQRTAYEGLKNMWLADH